MRFFRKDILKTVTFQFQILKSFKRSAGEEEWKRFADQFPQPLREQMKIQYGVWRKTTGTEAIKSHNVHRSLFIYIDNTVCDIYSR